ncbi:MAG: ATP-binding cassette domain-containing protein [Bacteroidia bacterium]|nr:ATP-binding cassette domain-containing protein [Bacteroidia bacterium]
METRRILTFENVAKSFHGKTILENVSFNVHLGEFLYIIGKTGSGKSTLLKMIYADQKPDSGKIIFGDFDLGNISQNQIPFLRRKLGIVFQDFQLLPDRNVYDNISFCLRASGWTQESKISARIQEVMEKVGLNGKEKAMPHQLSGGEQQRVVIARALINDPLLLIADEPTGNLDPEMTDTIMELLRKINLSGTAILMVTHEHILLKRYPARALHITGKTVLEYSRSEQLLKDLYD